MKKLIITFLLFLNFTPIKADIWGKIIGGSTSAVLKIGNVVEDARSFVENQLPGCAEVVGLGTAYGSAQAALATASFALESAEVIGRKGALDRANDALEAAKQTSVGVLKLGELVAKGLGEGFNITCIRFLGSLEELEFELNGKVAGNDVNIKEKITFSDVESFAKKIFDKLKDKAEKIFS